MAPAPTFADDSAARHGPAPGYEIEVGSNLEGTDLSQALALLERVYPGKFSRSTWEWKYSRHYLGPPRIAVARSGGRIVGLQPSLRHEIDWAGDRRIAYQFTDVLTHPEHRRRGIFTALVEALANAAAREGAVCAFTFPNQRSYSGFARLGTWEHPFSLPLLFRPLIRRRRRQENVRTPSFQTGPVERFDSNFDGLSAGLASRFGAVTRRDHRYLNWRYIDAPDRPCLCLGARQANRWRALVVGRIVRWLGVRVGVIVELLGELDGLRELIPVIEQGLREQGARALGALLPPGSREADLLNRLGYRTLPAWLIRKEFYFFTRKLQDPSAPAGPEGRWWLTWGNIDIV